MRQAHRKQTNTYRGYTLRDTESILSATSIYFIIMKPKSASVQSNYIAYLWLKDFQSTEQLLNNYSPHSCVLFDLWRTTNWPHVLVNDFISIAPEECRPDSRPDKCIHSWPQPQKYEISEKTGVFNKIYS